MTTLSGYSARQTKPYLHALTIAVVLVSVTDPMHVTFPPETDPGLSLGLGSGSWRKGDEQEAVQAGGDRQQAA